MLIIYRIIFTLNFECPIFPFTKSSHLSINFYHYPRHINPNLSLPLHPIPFVLSYSPPAPNNQFTSKSHLIHKQHSYPRKIC